MSSSLQAYDGGSELMRDDFGFDVDTSLGDAETTMDRHDALLKELTSFDTFIKDKINGYLGLVWDEDKKEYVKDPDVEPIMNRKGAKWLIDNLKTYTRGNNMVTFIRKDQYINIMCNIIDVLWFGFGMRAKKHFGVKSSGDLLRVCSELEDACALVLMGSGDGKVMNFLEGTTKYTYADSAGVRQGGMVDSMESKPGFFGRVKRVFTGY